MSTQFLVQYTETTNYRRSLTREQIIQYVGEDVLTEHFNEDLESVTDEELAKAVVEINSDGGTDELEEEMQPYGDVQGTDWTIDVIRPALSRMRDADGDVWDRGDDGRYRITAWEGSGDGPGALTLEVLDKSYGPLEPITG